MYDKLVAKENNIDTSEFVLKTKYDTAKLDLEKKISDADKEISDNIGLAKKRDYNVKISEIIAKIPNIAGLATNTALTAAENKMPDISSLVKKTTTKKADYNSNISDIENKYIATADYNKFTKNIVDNNIKSKNLVDKLLLLDS